MYQDPDHFVPLEKGLLCFSDSRCYVVVEFFEKATVRGTPHCGIWSAVWDQWSFLRDHFISLVYLQFQKCLVTNDWPKIGVFWAWKFIHKGNITLNSFFTYIFNRIILHNPFLKVRCERGIHSLYFLFSNSRWSSRSQMGTVACCCHGFRYPGGTVLDANW